MTALLGWLYANVAGNLVASAVTFAAALTWHHRRVAAMVARLHERVDHLHDKVDELRGGDGD